jgi:hypothetical protein
MSLAGIKENDKKFITNKLFNENVSKTEDDNFIIYEFEQNEFPLGDDDDLYKIKFTKKDD